MENNRYPFLEVGKIFECKINDIWDTDENTINDRNIIYDEKTGHAYERPAIKDNKEKIKN